METVEERFEKWWAEIGSGLLPIQSDDFESHAKMVSIRAWLAGERAALFFSPWYTNELTSVATPKYSSTVSSSCHTTNTFCGFA